VKWSEPNRRMDYGRCGAILTGKMCKSYHIACVLLNSAIMCDNMFQLFTCMF